MEYNKVLKLINEATKEALGENAINLKDDNFLNLLSDFVFSYYENTEKFHSTLIKVIKHILYPKIDNVSFGKKLEKITNCKKFDFCVINEEDSIAIVNINKIKKQNLKDLFEFVILKYDEIYYIEDDKEIFNKIYDLYRRNFKYKDYINYKGGYKYEKIH